MNSYKFNYYPCPLCGNKNPENIFSRGVYFDQIHISVCKDCGIVSQNPRLSESYYRKYYSGDGYYGKYQPKICSTEHADMGIKSRAANIYRHIRSLLTSTVSVLEIGAGSGDNLFYLQKMGYRNLEAIEINKDCVKLINEQGIKCFNVSLEKYQARNTKKFDIIILSHVLEHLAHPDIALSIIGKMLKKNGCVYFLLPDFGAGNPYPQFTLPHVYYFTIDTLSSLLNQFGFKIIKKYNSGPEMEILCKQSKKGYEPSGNQYSQIKSRLKRYKKPKITFKEGLLGKFHVFIPLKLYQLIMKLYFL